MNNTTSFAATASVFGRIQPVTVVSVGADPVVVCLDGNDVTHRVLPDQLAVFESRAANLSRQAERKSA